MVSNLSPEKRLEPPLECCPTEQVQESLSPEVRLDAVKNSEKERTGVNKVVDKYKERNLELLNENNILKEQIKKLKIRNKVLEVELQKKEKFDENQNPSNLQPNSNKIRMKSLIEELYKISKQWETEKVDCPI